MKRKALFVGVNEYKDSQIRNLNYSLSDAHAMKTYFELFGYVTDILENPGKSDVLHAVRSMTADMAAGDFFLFYFAGHGWTTSGGKHLLFCSDDIYEDLRYDYNVGIPFDYLKKRTESGGYNRAFVLDACRSDFITGARGEDATTRDLRPIAELVKDAPEAASIAVLRSCSQYEHALEIDSRKHGLFTLAMMDVFRSSRSDGKELCFGEALCDAVTERMRTIAREVGITAPQTPEFAKTGIAQVLIAGSKPAAKSSIPVVACPVCGKNNLITETFNCAKCGTPHLCLSHFSKEYMCCNACAKKLDEKKKADERQSRIAKEEQEKMAKAAAKAKARAEATRKFKEAFMAKRYDEAAALKDAVDLGNKAVQFDLGVMYDNGMGVARNFDEALKWYRKAAEQGAAAAQNCLGWAYENGCSCVKDYAEALKWYRKAAEQGYAKAEYNLGIMYRKGKGVGQDFPASAWWFRKAAEQGLAVAQCKLAEMCYKGEGVVQDHVEAVGWYLKAAAQGLAVAQYYLGYMYETGIGVSLDYAEALKWFRKAAEQEYAKAQFNLGGMYKNGWGVPQDYALALKWYRKAAEQGLAVAQCNLGWLYETGMGVSRDYAEAVKWYRKAAEQGCEDAQENLKRLGA